LGCGLGGMMGRQVKVVRKAAEFFPPKNKNSNWPAKIVPRLSSWGKGKFIRAFHLQTYVHT